MASRILTFTVGNKKTFPAGTDGRRLVTLADLDGISDFTVTADQATGAVWDYVTLSYSQFATADTTNEINVYQLPSKCVIHDCIVHTVVNFAGGAISDYDISVGISGNATKYCTATDVDGGASVSVHQATLMPESWTSTVNIKATATSVGANLDAATAGSVTIYFLISELE